MAALATSAKQDTINTNITGNLKTSDLSIIGGELQVKDTDVDGYLNGIQTQLTTLDSVADANKLNTDKLAKLSNALTWNKTQFRTNNVGTIFTNSTGNTIIAILIVCSTAASSRNGNLKLNSTAAGAGNAFTNFDNATDSLHLQFNLVLANTDYIYYYESSADYIQGVVFYAEI